MKLTALAVIILAALAALGIASQVEAGADLGECTVTDKKLLVGRDKITGTAVVTLTNFNPSGTVPTADQIDAVLTLKFHGSKAVFGATILGPLSVESPEKVMCEVLATAVTANPPVVDISTAFGIPADQQLALCLVREENAGTQAGDSALTCQSIVDLAFPGTAGTTSGTADLNVYVIPVAP